MKNIQKILLPFGLVLLLTALLTACGGGGGGGGGGISATPSGDSGNDDNGSPASPTAPPDSSSAIPKAFFDTGDNFPVSLSADAMKRPIALNSTPLARITASSAISSGGKDSDDASETSKFNALIQSNNRIASDNRAIAVGVHEKTISYIRQTSPPTTIGTLDNWAVTLGTTPKYLKINLLSATISAPTTVNGYTRQIFSDIDPAAPYSPTRKVWDLKILSYLNSGGNSWLAGGFWFASSIDISGKHTGVEFGAYLDGVETKDADYTLPTSEELTYNGSYFALHTPSSGSNITPQEYHGNVALTVTAAGGGVNPVMNGSFGNATNTMKPNDPTNLSFTIKDVPLRPQDYNKPSTFTWHGTDLTQGITANCGSASTACQQGEGNIAARFYGDPADNKYPPQLGGVFSVGDLQFIEDKKTVTGNLFGVFGTDHKNSSNLGN